MPNDDPKKALDEAQAVDALSPSNLLQVGQLAQIFGDLLAKRQQGTLHSSLYPASSVGRLLPAETLPPNPMGYAPQGAGFMAFTGGSPFPIDQDPMIVHNAGVLLQNLLEAYEAFKAYRKGKKKTEPETKPTGTP